MKFYYVNAEVDDIAEVTGIAAPYFGTLAEAKQVARKVREIAADHCEVYVEQVEVATDRAHILRLLNARTCDKCHDAKMARYRPDVLKDPDYWHDEPIDD